MLSAILYALLTGSLFYLGSRAVITMPLWRRYPPALARFMDCPACTGFWYGLLVSLTLGGYFDLNYLGLHGRSFVTPLVVALCSITTTPIAAALLQRSLETAGSAVQDDAE